MNFLANSILSSPYLGVKLRVARWRRGVGKEGDTCIPVCPGQELRGLGPWF